ncbi:uncharacterized protein LOC131335134 [Rhododendron vialii]|uniref:uncharacterized protein LOC131335134 n=1 Tax=Rhododendron vialii TaxID=182163 RepID=UPI00265EB85A|nr:uncharacterized protein LOC131335134 [Rhododendron vialii]
MDMPFDEIQRDLERLEQMEDEYRSLARGKDKSVGSSRSVGLEEIGQKELKRKRDVIEQFEQEFRNKVASFKAAIKVSNLQEMQIIRKLKNGYGFEGSVLISKYVSYSERKDIIDLAGFNRQNSIDYDEESTGPSPKFEDHWTVRKD